MQLFRHKETIFDFFSYMRRCARGGHINEMAASLSYTTILSLVPMLTVSFAVLTALPKYLKLRKAFQDWLSDNFIPGNIGDPILMYLNQFATKAKGLTLLGTIGLVLAIVFTLITIENAFNRIWSVQNPRPLVHRFGIYLMATFLGPLLLGVSIYLSSMVMSASHGWISPLTRDLNFVASVFPVLLSTLTFSLVYKVLPYAQVNWNDAIWGGLFAAMGFEFAKYGFTWFVASFPLYKTVYGAFAIVPLFLVWIYITWWVTLAGATLVANLPIIRAWDRQLSTRESPEIKSPR